MKKENKKDQKTSQITYSGKVTLKFMKKNKLIKSVEVNNNCTNRLLYGLALHISSKGVAQLADYVPRYMGLGSSNAPNNGIANRTNLVEPIGLRSNITALNPERDTSNNSSSAVLQSLFTYNSIQDRDIGEIGTYSNSSGETLLSRIPLEEKEKITPGMSLIVYWSIEFANKE